MVFGIRPFANHLNHAIDLEYQKSPAVQGSWYQFLKSEKPIPSDHAPISIVSKRSTPLPDAFEISRDFWCVSSRPREMMERLFGAQITFYEVPVAVEGSGASLPSTHFVTFSHFRSSIDWRVSKVSARALSPSMPGLEIISLADVPGAAVFTASPKDQEMIWIERRLQQGSRHFVPGFDVYVTNAGALLISQTFPKDFALTEFRESATKTTFAQH
jgi:hypothetical protein